MTSIATVARQQSGPRVVCNDCGLRIPANELGVRICGSAPYSAVADRAAWISPSTNVRFLLALTPNRTGNSRPVMASATAPSAASSAPDAAGGPHDTILAWPHRPRPQSPGCSPSRSAMPGWTGQSAPAGAPSGSAGSKCADRLSASPRSLLAQPPTADRRCSGPTSPHPRLSELCDPPDAAGHPRECSYPTELRARCRLAYW